MRVSGGLFASLTTRATKSAFRGVSSSAMPGSFLRDPAVRAAVSPDPLRGLPGSLVAVFLAMIRCRGHRALRTATLVDLCRRLGVYCDAEMILDVEWRQYKYKDANINLCETRL